MILPNKKMINTFTVCQQVNDRLVELVFCLFSSYTMGQSGKRFSYSIVGKIKGLHVADGIAEITASYQSKTVLTDRLSLVDGQFIYSNKSNEAVVLSIKVRALGVLSWQGDVDLTFHAKLRYASQKLTVHSIHSSYVSKMRARSTPEIMIQTNLPKAPVSLLPE